MRFYCVEKCFLFLLLFLCFSTYLLLYKFQMVQLIWYQPRKVLINNNSQTDETFKTELSSESYLKLHEKIITGHGEPRVVFYEIRKDIGYGNRMYSMLSAFMAAVLLDSALLINWPHFDQYYDCNLTNVFTNFSDQSFLDPNQKKPEICKIYAYSALTWNPVKRIEVFNSNKNINKVTHKIIRHFFCLDL